MSDDSILRGRRERLATRDWAIPVFGLMHRMPWTETLLTSPPPLLTWLEIFPENFMRRGARHVNVLERLSARFPFTSHGVHLSIGGATPPEDDYLADLRGILDTLDVPWFSDHLGASVHEAEILHEILPMPFNEASVERVAARSQRVSAAIGRPLILENAAYYLIPPGSTMNEHTFWSTLLERAPDLGILLDVNNLWVNATNHGYDIDAFLDAIPPERVKEIHIGGFTVDRELGLLIDTHGAPPSPPVWRLLTHVLKRIGPRPVLYEYEGHAKGFEPIREILDHLHHSWRRAAELA